MHILLRKLGVTYTVSDSFLIESRHFTQHQANVFHSKCSAGWFSIAPFAGALHEQDMVKLRESAFYSGQEEIASEERTDPMEELRAAKNRSFWRTTEGRPDKRANYKGSLEVGQGDARITREIELIWWPGLFSATNHGKLTVRFFVRKVTL